MPKPAGVHSQRDWGLASNFVLRLADKLVYRANSGGDGRQAATVMAWVTGMFTFVGAVCFHIGAINHTGWGFHGGRG